MSIWIISFISLLCQPQATRFMLSKFSKPLIANSHTYIVSQSSSLTSSMWYWYATEMFSPGGPQRFTILVIWKWQVFCLVQKINVSMKHTLLLPFRLCWEVYLSETTFLTRIKYRAGLDFVHRKWIGSSLTEYDGFAVMVVIYFSIN